LLILVALTYAILHMSDKCLLILFIDMNGVRQMLTNIIY